MEEEPQAELKLVRHLGQICKKGFHGARIQTALRCFQPRAKACWQSENRSENANDDPLIDSGLQVQRSHGITISVEEAPAQVRGHSVRLGTTAAMDRDWGRVVETVSAQSWVISLELSGFPEVG